MGGILMENVIKINKLKYAQGDFQLLIDELNIPKGYITGLIGENGAGKTTLIYQLLNITSPQTGLIKIFDKTYQEDRKGILSDIGVVYSENHYPDWMNAKKLSKLLQLYYANFNEATFNHYLDQFEVPSHIKIKHMSQGMKVKLSLAVALSHDAKLLILDEPTSNLDPTFRVALLKIFQDLMLDENKTILFSTHITSDLEAIADYIAYIQKGSLLFMEEKDVILDSYRVVKGETHLLDDEVKSLLIGIESEHGLFTGLTVDAKTFHELFGNQVSIRHANIDEIMYFKKRERLHHEKSI